MSRQLRRRRSAVAPSEGDDARGGEARPTGLRRVGRLLGLAGGGVAALGAVGIGLFPTQTFLDQRAATSEAQERLAVIDAQNYSFEERIQRLGSDEEIERLAREQDNLAFPGEEAYAVLPAPLPPLDLPEVWPFGPLLAPTPEPAAEPAPAP